jgi:rare lipoprotein A
VDFRPIICRALAALLAAMLAGCGSAPPKDGSVAGASTPPASGPSAPRIGSSKYWLDDGPGDNPPANLDVIPDAVPRLEPLHRFANRPYTVLGRDYVPATELRAYRERGIASWYGRKFHGQKTSTGETYDMYAMTAAHPTLPLPSYARVSNPANGRSVVVRVNDRGPFLHGRVIDLSYAAAHRLGIAQPGSGEVEVEALIPGRMVVASAPLPPVGALPAPSPADLSVAVPAKPADNVPASGAFAVQLGAFANFANAQSFLAHVQNQTAAANVEPRIREFNRLYRVYVGPYADRDEARRAAERIAQVFGFATTVIAH